MPIPIGADVCAFDSPDGVGGPYVWMQRMPQALRERGIEVRVRLFHWGPEENGVLFHALRNHHFSFTTHSFVDGESNVRSLLIKVLHDPPDVFVADNVIPGLLAGRYLRQSGIPTVGILRSDDPFYHGVIDRFVAGKSVDRLSVVVCVSRFLSETVRQKRTGSLVVETIASGTPIPNRRTMPPSDKLNVIYVGRLLEEQKRISDTTQPLIRLVSVLPDVAVTMFGDGPDRSRVEELIRPFSPQISLTGNVRSEELTNQLLKSHVIVLLSDYEGTPTAVMENGLRNRLRVPADSKWHS